MLPSLSSRRTNSAYHDVAVCSHPRVLSRTTAATPTTQSALRIAPLPSIHPIGPFKIEIRLSLSRIPSDEPPRATLQKSLQGLLRQQACLPVCYTLALLFPHRRSPSPFPCFENFSVIFFSPVLLSPDRSTSIPKTAPSPSTCTSTAPVARSSPAWPSSTPCSTSAQKW